MDAAGDPVLDKESGKRVAAEDFIASYKVHPIYGTFFKGQKGSGAGIGYGGTDANGMPTEDLSSSLLLSCSSVHLVDNLTKYSRGAFRPLFSCKDW